MSASLANATAQCGEHLTEATTRPGVTSRAPLPPRVLVGMSPARPQHCDCVEFKAAKAVIWKVKWRTVAGSFGRSLEATRGVLDARRHTARCCQQQFNGGPRVSMSLCVAFGSSSLSKPNFLSDQTDVAEIRMDTSPCH